MILPAESLAVWKAVLPPGVEVDQSYPPPHPQVDFEEHFKLPAHSTKPLQTLHTHPLDERLSFLEEPHIYLKDGLVPTTTSVTSCAHEFDEEFDGLAAISGMKAGRSQSWPRLEYVLNAKEADAASYAPGQGILAHAEGKTISVVQPHSLGEASTFDHAMRMLRVIRNKSSSCSVDDEGVTFHSFDRELTEQEILDSWARKGRLACNMGTEGHYLAELYFNGLPTRWWEGEMKVVQWFAETHMMPKQLVAYNTEKEILCLDADLAGSLDLIVYDPRLKIHHIVDHKRSPKLKQDLRGYKKMKAPFTHLDACKGAAYALQTSIYQYVLERDYGMRIGSRVLLSIHPDVPFVTSVPYLRAEVEYIMNRRFALTKARNTVADAHSELRCALTAAPLVDAVTVTSEGPHKGKLAMEKAAVVAGVEHEPAQSVRDRFEAEVQAVMETVELDKSKCINWRKLMPEGGLPPF